MSEPDAPAGETDARVAELLGELSDDPDLARPDLTRRVVRTAKWQRTFRRAFEQVSSLFGSLTQGTAGMLGVRRDGEDAKK